MACNPAMDKNAPKLHPDAALIDSLGGPAALARLLAFDKPGSVQRIQNWKYRGIPELERLRRPDVFGPPPQDGPVARRRAAVEGAAAANSDDDEREAA